MLLNIDLLQNPRLKGGKVIARCPACAESGGDRRCEHLVIFDSGHGHYSCVADPDGAGGEHSKRIHKLVGIVGTTNTYFRVKRSTVCQPLRTNCHLPRVPSLRSPTLREIQHLAELRHWPYYAGLELLSRRGLFHCGNVQDNNQAFPAWIIADSARRNIQARRMDGKHWEGIGGAKAKSLAGSQGSWPIGAADIGDRPIVVLTEGGPDFCCTLLVAWFEGLPTQAIAPVTMTGAGNAIHDDALPYFREKRVRILEHNDTAGANASKRWADQLWNAGAAQVDGVRFDGITMSNGSPAKDLGDFAILLDEESPPTVQILSDLACLIQ